MNRNYTVIWNNFNSIKKLKLTPVIIGTGTEMLVLLFKNFKIVRNNWIETIEWLEIILIQ